MITLKDFEDTGALLKGRFRLSSGLHSDTYLQCARLLQWPARAEAAGRELAPMLTGFSPRVIVSPALGGLIIGHETARVLGVPFLFAERQDGAFTLRRGFAIEAGDPVAIVEDVFTTGKSTREVIETRAGRAAVVAAGSIVDREAGGRCRSPPAPPVIGSPGRVQCPLAARRASDTQGRKKRSVNVTRLPSPVASPVPRSPSPVSQPPFNLRPWNCVASATTAARPPRWKDGREGDPDLRPRDREPGHRPRLWGLVARPDGRARGRSPGRGRRSDRRDSPRPGRAGGRPPRTDRAEDREHDARAGADALRTGRRLRGFPRRLRHSPGDHRDADPGSSSASHGKPIVFANIEGYFDPVLAARSR